MRRIPIPTCTCCKSARAEWESEAWPSVKLCYRCTRETAQIIVEKIGVTHGNPILLELITGLDTAKREASHRFWIENQNGSYSECWVNESRNPE